MHRAYRAVCSHRLRCVCFGKAAAAAAALRDQAVIAIINRVIPVIKKIGIANWQKYAAPLLPVITQFAGGSDESFRLRFINWRVNCAPLLERIGSWIDACFARRGSSFVSFFRANRRSVSFFSRLVDSSSSSSPLPFARSIPTSFATKGQPRSRTT